MLTDPTYLRYIVDGLNSQSIQQENLAALPQGLIGIYEEALPWEQNTQERGRFLQFFSAWALLKKEVSAILVSSLLNWPEQEVVDALATHTKWFNSPASGTYILYHERLRTYLLSKITSNQLKQTNQKIIESCQHALELKKGDEWEIYALEHLPSHLLITAMQDEEQGATLRKLVYDTSYWNRQVEISKGYDWSKKMLNLAMVWAAKQNTDELIECALNKIDLHYMEQNDAPRIVELVAQNDIETALQRIESFGGNDKEGLQQKFTLYMLCMMELTLLDSKDKSFRKSAIEKILNHLDENIPADHSLLKWNDFFPSYLMFQMACEWAEMGLDYLRVYKRTRVWDSDWIPQMGEYNSTQIDVLIESLQIISSDILRSDTQFYISNILIKKNYFDKAINFARQISKTSDKNKNLRAICTRLVEKGELVQALKCISIMNSLTDECELLMIISNELFKLKEFEKADFLMKKSIDCARKIKFESIRCTLFKNISFELIKQGKELESDLIVKEALEYARNMDSEVYKCEVLIQFSLNLRVSKKIHLAEMLIEESIEIALKIIDKSEKVDALNRISIELLKQGNIKLAVQILNHSLDNAWEIYDNKKKDSALVDISIESAKQNYFEQALDCAHSISNEEKKSEALWYISQELSKQNKLKESKIVFQEALESALRVIYAFGFGRTSAFKEICSELTRLGRIKDAYTCLHNISNDVFRFKAMKFITSELSRNGYLNDLLKFIKNKRKEHYDNSILISISDELAKKGRIENAASFIKNTLVFFNGKSSLNWKSRILKDIATGFLIQDKSDHAKVVLMESLKCIYGINDEWVLSSAVINISFELINLGKIEELIKCISGMKSYDYKCQTLIFLANELKKNGKHAESITILKQALHSANSIDSVSKKCKRLILISSELGKQGSIEESILIIQDVINFANNLQKGYELIHLENIAIELAYNGEIEHAISCLNRVKNERSKSKILKVISIVLAKQKKLEAAIDCLRDITDLNEKSIALIYLSTELKESKIFNEANKMIDEALKIVYRNDYILSQKYLKEFINGLLKNGMIEKALECAYKLNKDSDEFSVFEDISVELSKQQNIILAEKTGMTIPQIADRHNCWKNIANHQKDQFGLLRALRNKNKFQSQEAQTYYLKGWADSITVDDITDELAHLAVQALQHDSTSLEYFLQVYAQHELFFGNATKEKINRLNKTLNIQWAIDIKESLVAE